MDTAALVRAATERAGDLRGLLAGNIAQARQVVRQLLEGRLVCQPYEDAENRGYAFTATGTYRRLGVPELVNVGGGPNGIRTRVSALRGPCPRPLDDGAGRASAASCVYVALLERRKWLGEEGSNPHYQGQNLASYH